MELEPIEDQIIIHHHVLQKFLKHGKDYANLLALYSFYIYHAQLQKTNQPLVTDEFTRRGMNWASDRVKRIKKILKEMKLIEVVQKRKYYYVHLFFIYTKKKIDEILGNCNENEKSQETEDLAPQKPKVEKNVETTKLKPLVPSVPTILDKWTEYCDKNSINYGKNNVKYWEKKLKNRLSIEQQEAIYKAINREWKDFYIVPLKESKYHKFLGKSLMMERDCDTLLDIGYVDKQYIYQFKNIKISTTAPPLELFKKYGYERSEVKTAPIISTVQEKILGLIKRF